MYALPLCEYLNLHLAIDSSVVQLTWKWCRCFFLYSTLINIYPISIYLIFNSYFSILSINARVEWWYPLLVQISNHHLPNKTIRHRFINNNSCQFVKPNQEHQDTWASQIRSEMPVSGVYQLHHMSPLTSDLEEGEHLKTGYSSTLTLSSAHSSWTLARKSPQQWVPDSLSLEFSSVQCLLSLVMLGLLQSDSLEMDPALDNSEELVHLNPYLKTYRLCAFLSAPCLHSWESSLSPCHCLDACSVFLWPTPIIVWSAMCDLSILNISN